LSSVYENVCVVQVNKKVINRTVSSLHVKYLQCEVSKPFVLCCLIFSRDKTELNELVCDEWLQTLLHLAGLVSQEQSWSSGDKSHLDYQGNGVLYSVVLNKGYIFMYDCGVAYSFHK
jgi:hypothetical protein